MYDNMGNFCMTNIDPCLRKICLKMHVIKKDKKETHIKILTNSATIPPPQNLTLRLTAGPLKTRANQGPTSSAHKKFISNSKSE